MYWRKLQGQTHLLDTLIMVVWRTEKFLESFEKTSNPKSEYSFPCAFIVRYVIILVFIFELWNFFQTILKKFLCATHTWLKYPRGAFDLEVYASIKIRNIGRTNPKIFKETSTKRGFSKSTLKSKELNVGQYSFLLIFELRNFFKGF